MISRCALPSARMLLRANLKVNTWIAANKKANLSKNQPATWLHVCGPPFFAPHSIRACQWGLVHSNKKNCFQEKIVVFQKTTFLVLLEIVIFPIIVNSKSRFGEKMSFSGKRIFFLKTPFCTMKWNNCRFLENANFSSMTMMLFSLRY